MARSIRLLAVLTILGGCGASDVDAITPADAGPRADAAPPPDAARPSTPGITAYRFDSFGLADPHLHVLVGAFCIDITGIVNTVATRFLQEDALEPHNGFLDGSLALVFRQLDLGASAENVVDFEVPRCTAPWNDSTCSGDAETPRYSTTTRSQAAGACLEVLPGTAVDVPRFPQGPCFSSAPTTLELEFLGAKITLRDASGAAAFEGDRLEDGVIRGFLSKADADALMLTIPDVGTRSMSSFLEGGGSCRDAAENPRGDLDVGPNGEDGWYVYLTFGAARTPYLAR